MTKIQERVISEYTKEYTWMKYYCNILYYDKFNLDEEEAEKIKAEYLKHSYALNVASKCFSSRESNKYLPDARAKAVEKADEMYVNWLRAYGKDERSVA